MEFNYWLIIYSIIGYITTVAVINIWFWAMPKILSKTSTKKEFKKEKKTLKKTKTVFNIIVAAFWSSFLIFMLFTNPMVYNEDQEELTRPNEGPVEINDQLITKTIKERANESLDELKQTDNESVDEYDKFLKGIKK
jgi:hypothetical protein